MDQSSTKEYAVEAALVKGVEELGGWTLKGDRIQGRRFIDRICILPGGVTAYVECKRPRGGRYEAHQTEILERLEALGHPVFRVKNRQEVNACLAMMTIAISNSSGR